MLPPPTWLHFAPTLLICCCTDARNMRRNKGTKKFYKQHLDVMRMTTRVSWQHSASFR